MHNRSSIEPRAVKGDKHALCLVDNTCISFLTLNTSVREINMRRAWKPSVCWCWVIDANACVWESVMAAAPPFDAYYGGFFGQEPLWGSEDAIDPNIQLQYESDFVLEEQKVSPCFSLWIIHPHWWNKDVWRAGAEKVKRTLVVYVCVWGGAPACKMSLASSPCFFYWKCTLKSTLPHFVHWKGHPKRYIIMFYLS